MTYLQALKNYIQGRSQDPDRGYNGPAEVLKVAISELWHMRDQWHWLQSIVKYWLQWLGGDYMFMTYEIANFMRSHWAKWSDSYLDDLYWNKMSTIVVNEWIKAIKAKNKAKKKELVVS